MNLFVTIMFCFFILCIQAIPLFHIICIMMYLHSMDEIVLPFSLMLNILEIVLSTSLILKKTKHKFFNIFYFCVYITNIIITFQYIPMYIVLLVCITFLHIIISTFICIIVNDPKYNEEIEQITEISYEIIKSPDEKMNKVNQIVPIEIIVIYKEEENIFDECSICLEPCISTDDLVRMPSCKHYFHKDCGIRSWNEQQKCPNCRQ